ncbi:MAG TPA: hypothetical protein VHZ24_19400 [Pirellulales bacterium]|nr:hypothetical protein [Pirellulales bacterium]
MLDDIVAGRDASLEALQIEASAIGVRTVVVGGVAVIRHGYRRTTTDRDVLIDFRDAPRLADRLMESSDWERLEIRQYAFLHKPTNMVVDFLVSGDLVQLGRPYLFPFIDKIETVEPVGGIPVIGLHDLLWLKLLAGRMRDLGDMMELCKLHLGNIEPDRVLASLEPEDDDLRQTMLEIIRKAPIEIANERRLGQGLHPDYKKKPS